MGDILRIQIRDAYMQIKTAKTMFEKGLNSLSIALDTVGKCEELALQNGLGNLPLSDLPVTEHRRNHRSGVPPKIDGDPELRAFILARIDRMGYVEIATAVSEHFPKPRHVGKSTIHAWIKRYRRPK